jgi:hypothetical protein
MRRDWLSCVQGFTNLYRSVTNLYAPPEADVFTYLELSVEQGKHRAASLTPGERHVVEVTAELSPGVSGSEID